MSNNNSSSSCSAHGAGNVCDSWTGKRLVMCGMLNDVIEDPSTGCPSYEASFSQNCPPASACYEDPCARSIYNNCTEKRYAEAQKDAKKMCGFCHCSGSC